MKALGTRVIIQLITVEEKSQAGIYVPETSKKKRSEGVVKYIGTEVTSVKPGDRVLFSPFHYDDVSEEDDLVCIEEEYLWAILDKKDENVNEETPVK